MFTEEEKLKSQVNRFRYRAIQVIEAKNISEFADAMNELKREVSETNFYYPKNQNPLTQK